jgi:hypothetical protein
VAQILTNSLIDLRKKRRRMTKKKIMSEYWLFLNICNLIFQILLSSKLFYDIDESMATHFFFRLMLPVLMTVCNSSTKDSCLFALRNIFASKSSDHVLYGVSGIILDIKVSSVAHAMRGLQKKL